jgi:hypothetical protein
MDDAGTYGSLAEIGAALRDEGRAVIPVLEEWLGRVDGSSLPRSLKKLGARGAPLIEEVKRYYRRSSDHNARISALQTLSSFGADLSPLAKEYVPRLAKQFAHAVRGIGKRREVDQIAGHLKAYGSAGAEATSTLTRLLRSRDHGQAAAEILGAIGPAAKDAVPALQRATFGRYETSKAASRALRSIRDEATEVK